MNDLDPRFPERNSAIADYSRSNAERLCLLAEKWEEMSEQARIGMANERDPEVRADINAQRLSLIYAARELRAAIGIIYPKG